MHKILADSSLPDITHYFPSPFVLRFYEGVPVLRDETILLCRASLSGLPRPYGPRNDGRALKYILTASSGRDHLDLDYLAQHNIQVLDAKGANANAVVQYVLATLTALKTQGVHPKTVGIIGLGAIGSRLQTHLISLGHEVIGYDPYLSLAVALEDLTQCDCLCIHTNLHDTLPYPSRNLLNQAFFKQCSPHMCIINAARGGIVHEADLLAYFKGIYCTDVYCNEPVIHPAIVARATLCTPHIAGHTVEAKAAIMARLSEQLHGVLQLPYTPSSRGLSAGHSVYDPFIETNALKANPGDFITLRQAHYRSERLLSV